MNVTEDAISSPRRLGRAGAAAVLVVLVTALLTGCGSPVDRAGGLQGLLDQWRQRCGAPAAVLAVRGPHERWTGASGTLRPGSGRPATPQDQFRVASITKLFVATVVLQLVSEGALDLEDPLSSFVPDVPGAEDVTVRQLLNHTSGIADYGQVEGFADELLAEPHRTWSTAEVLALAAGRSAEFAPGTDFAYSNTNYVLLGEVVETVTGRPWPTVLRDRVLDPLHLQDTYVAGMEEGDPVVPGYVDADGDGTLEEAGPGSDWPALASTEGAAGALVSTADDLVSFADALFHGQLLDEAALAEMSEEGPHHARNASYGLGLEVERRDYRTTTWGHGGMVPGFRSVLRYVPAEDLVVVALVNDSTCDAGDLAELAQRSTATR